MPILRLKTEISAPIDVVFDLARSIDLHKISTAHTQEEAIAGVTSGLIKLGETVTWRAKHFGIWQTLTSKITGFERPSYFADEMVTGAFESFLHEHFFEEVNGNTVMCDTFSYRSPFGLLGKLADRWFLEAYIRTLLEKRNEIIKEFAESDRWKELV